uniref:Uncharacterized protein n=1 Tax=Anopheles epiroticus TaxID=199890 RepID=A0A182P587_9DIPT
MFHSQLPSLLGSSLFGRRVEKPLMALSLESSETATEPAHPSNERPTSADYDDHEDEEGFYPLSSYQLRRLTSSRRFYDTVLGVLQVLEAQARHQVQRARWKQLESFTFAARLRRDVIEDGVQTLKKTVSETFTKENVDKNTHKRVAKSMVWWGRIKPYMYAVRRFSFMAKLVFLIVALCAVQGSFALVRRDAPAAPAEEPNFFQTIMNIKDKIEGVFQETQQNVLKSLGFQSNEEVVQTIQQNTNQYVEKLKSVQSVLDEEVKKNTDIFDPILKDLKAKIAQTMTTLSEQNPEVAQKAKEYQEQVQTNVQALVAEAQKTVEKLKEDTRVPTENIQDALKKLYDSTFETLTKTANELKQKN